MDPYLCVAAAASRKRKTRNEEMGVFGCWKKILLFLNEISEECEFGGALKFSVTERRR